MSARVVRLLAILLCLASPLAGCAVDSPDGIDDVGLVPGGKADGSDYSPCELDAVVAYLNGGPSEAELYESGLHRRASKNLAEAFAGPDGARGTDDDGFADIAAVDAVSWVGPVAMRQLVEMVQDRCLAPAAPSAEVIMSPQPYEQSHVATVEALIREVPDNGRIDIAMYSYSDANVGDALEDAVRRGVRVRFLFESANADRSSPEGSKSARLEEMGVEVRYVNKIMHHKFAILNGPRDDLALAETGVLVTGSGNWSNGAATRFDENTLVFRGNSELNLRYQREFNYLWDNGREFVWNEDLAPIGHLDITEDLIVDDPDVDAIFTSTNFEAYENARYGPTFRSISGLNTVADRWVALIEGAQRSIRIASGHLRSRPIAEALIRAQQANPALDIRVYLDGQEYISEYTHDLQVQELDACLADASTETQTQGCLDRGFLFGYQIHAAGIDTRFKYYAYRWNYSYAPQMHHKYMIVDDEILITGSYNLSDNAEHNTMENDTILRGDAYREVIDAYIDNFDAIWLTGEEDGLFASLMDDVQNGTGDFPIVFDAMALDHDRVTALKRAIRDACPEVDSDAYRRNAAAHRYCDR